MSLKLARQASNDDKYSGPSEDEIPTPDLSTFRLLGDNLLIRPYTPKEKKIGGIILTDNAVADRQYLQTMGKVVKIGSGAYKDGNIKPGEPGYPWGWYGGPWVAVGEWVLYSRHSGQKIKFKGVEFLLIKDSYVLAASENPDDLDSNYVPI